MRQRGHINSLTHNNNKATTTTTMGDREIDFDVTKRLMAKYTACAIGCQVCIWSVIVTYAICAYITAFTGLSHTQHVVLDPLCPPGYWDSSISLIFIRFAVFCLAAFFICFSRKLGDTCCLVWVTVLSVVTIFSISVSDSVVTSQAILALNCSTAIRAGRDNDPLLIVSGSMFIVLDWVLCLCVCCTCIHRPREHADVYAVNE